MRTATRILDADNVQRFQEHFQADPRFA